MPAVASLLAWDVTALHQKMRNKPWQNIWKNDSINKNNRIVFHSQTKTWAELLSHVTSVPKANGPTTESVQHNPRSELITVEIG
jgi:hypothetical protein